MRRAYYNENDPKAAAWLRELIADGLIAPGDVDERSIVEVQPGDLRGYKQCHFFAGIGGWSYALRLAGIPDSARLWTGSCPCQPFSVAGKRRGDKDERHLWPEFHRLIRERSPSIVIGEQVASKDGREWLAGVFADLEALGYAVAGADLCAAGVTAPHIRQRLYWLADATGGRFRADGSAPGECGYSEQRIEVRGLADNSREGLERRTEQSAREERPSAERGSGNGGMGDSSCHEQREHRESRERDGWEGASGGSMFRGGGPESGGTGRSGGVAHTGHEAGPTEREQQLREHRSGPGQSGTSCGLDDSECAERWPDGNRGTIPGGWEQATAEQRGGGTTGFWRGIWHPCRDGKLRRIPLEPAIFPLADGIPGRVGILRGAGNAIVPAVAAEFIQAFLESRRVIE